MDVARIGRLIEQGVVGASDITVTTLERLFGGNARTAWSFDLRYREGDAWRELPCVMLSQPPAQHVASDVAQEFEVLRRLGGKGLRIPRALAVDTRGDIVGAPSIVLERLRGKASAVDLLRAEDVGLITDLATVVAELHATPCPHSLAPRELAARQVAHWQETFEAQRMEPLPIMASLFRWLAANVPEPQRISLVHGDLRPGNFLYEDGRVTGLLDWEMAHPGDPIEDLGWIYRPMWSPGGFVPLKDFVALYSHLSNIEVSGFDILYYRIFSELKFATISLTAARAFATKATRNLRHADRAAMVGPCLKRAIAYRKEARDARAEAR